MKSDILARGEPFRQVAIQSMREDIKDGWAKAGHDRNFKPAKMVEEKMYKMPFKYKELGGNDKDPKELRDEDGAVITGPKNFYTNPMKIGKVGKSVVFSSVKFMDGDKYDISRELASKEREYHDSKI